MSGLSCSRFDGRIDITRSILDKESYTQLEYIKEDHYVIVSYPGNVYVDHVAFQTGRSADITKELISVVRAKNSDKTLTAIVCDGTNVNTGYKHGVIRSLKEQLLKPLQWLICLLLCNKLPLRALITKLDGDTRGPREFKGPIGQQLSVDHKILKIADYPPLDAQPIIFLDTTTKELSTDQKYLLVASNAVIFGKNKLDQDTLRFLQRLSPGIIHHARWLTTANRLLRLYMSLEDPSNNLCKLIDYIVKVYSKSWFEIN